MIVCPLFNGQSYQKFNNTNSSIKEVHSSLSVELISTAISIGYFYKLINFVGNHTGLHTHYLLCTFFFGAYAINDFDEDNKKVGAQNDVLGSYGTRKIHCPRY